MHITAAVLGLVCVTCTERDVPGPHGKHNPPIMWEVPPIAVVAGFSCRVDIKDAELKCEETAIPAPPAVIQAAIVGGSGALLRSTNVSYNAATSDSARMSPSRIS